MMEEARSLNTFFRPITDKAEFPEVRARMILQTYRIIHPTKTAPSRATIMWRALAQQARLRRSATPGWCPGKVSVGVEMLGPHLGLTLRDVSVRAYSPEECVETGFSEVGMRDRVVCLGE